jgi:bifunctional DNA-binding transcriptional regulator/antitoxin component of YhaV-PrlF toxin-antitoxin module
MVTKNKDHPSLHFYVAHPTVYFTDRRIGYAVIMTTVVNDKTGLIVPPSVRREAGIKNGDRVEFRVSGGVINIVPRLPPAADECTPAQRRVIDRDLAKGLADIERGRLQGPFASHEEFTVSLHKEARKLGARKTKRRAR